MNKYSPLLLSTLTLCACSDPLVGDWKGKRSSFGDLSVKVKIEAKGEGSVTSQDDYGYYYKGSLEWEKEEKQDYEIKEECDRVVQDGYDETCVDENIKWLCEMQDGKDELECAVKVDGEVYRDGSGRRVKFEFRRDD